MHAIRDSVYQKLSKFFSDSQSSHETIDQDTEVRQYAKDDKSQSSILPFVLPSISRDWFRPNGRANEVKFAESNSFKWRAKSFSWKDKPLDKECNEDDKFDSHLENGEPGSGTSSSNSSDDVFEDAATPHTFEKPVPRLLDESIFVSQDLFQFFEASLPNIVKGCEWVLLYSRASWSVIKPLEVYRPLVEQTEMGDVIKYFYKYNPQLKAVTSLEQILSSQTTVAAKYMMGSTAKHGISLHTLVRKSACLNGPCLLITGDKQGAVFGGLLDCPLKPTAKRKYQGTNQCFVFTTLYGEPRLFRPTGANRYFYLCLNDLLALGGGANFALSLNEDLLCGTSGPCETFGNSGLAHDQEFELKNVELWGFTHASRYLNY